MGPAPPSPVSLAKAPLSVPAVQLDLGNLEEGVTFHHVLYLHNDSPGPIEVQTLSGSCSCLSISPTGPFVIRARQMVPGTIAIVPRLSEERPNALATVPFRTVIRATATTDTGEQIHPQWDLTANINPIMRVEPSLIRLGLVSNRQRPCATFSVTTRQDVDDVEIVCPKDWVAAPVKLVAGAPRRFSVEVQRSSFAPTPERSWEFRAVARAHDGRELAHKAVLLTAEVVPDLVFSPREIRLGVCEFRKVAQEPVRLTSLSGRSLKLIS